jgi:pimeloyl-ACP methyl ester carboxylesterase
MHKNIKHITSKDGTLISYSKTGSGDGLIIVHGAGRMASDYEQLATALSDNYTVYTYDRRGRGESGKISADHCIERECDDLEALLRETGAECVFGHSMGAVITLEAACRFPIANIAVYEPPVPIDNSVPTGFIDAFKTAISKKQYERAMAHGLKGLQLHEAAKLPVGLLVAIMKLMKLVKRKGKEWNKRMSETLPTLIVDLDLITRLNNTYEKYGKIRSVALLMGGAKSPAYLLEPLGRLKNIIPYSSKQIFKGFDHMAPEDHVAEISMSLKQFFK